MAKWIIWGAFIFFTIVGPVIAGVIQAIGERKRRRG